jgi:membrane-associated phospholipid phosphatase
MIAFFRNRFVHWAVLALILASIICSVALAILVQSHPVFSIDLAISRELQESTSRVVLGAMEFVSVFGVPWIALVTTLFVAWLFYRASLRREAEFTLMTILAGGVNALMKAIVNRPRPTDSLITVYQKLSDPSFPSGHVVYYVVFFGFLTAVMLTAERIPPAVRVAVVSVSIALVGLVSFSRIYLGVHWATDIVGGYCVGLALLAGVLHFYFSRPAQDA